MENLIISIVGAIIGLGIPVGMFTLFFFYKDGFILIETLKKLNYVPQMGVVLAPYIVMSSGEFGEPYTLKTWAITFALIIDLFIVTTVIQFFMNWLEERAERRQHKRQCKQKAVNFFEGALGKDAGKILEGIEFSNEKGTVERTVDGKITFKPTKKKTIKETFAILLAQSFGGTLGGAIGAILIIAVNEGFDELLNPLSILTVLFGLGISFLCKYGSKKLAPDLW